MTEAKTVVAPDLDIDKGRELSPRDVLQRRIVANFLAHMSEGGWTVSQVYSHGSYIPTSTSKFAMEVIHTMAKPDLTFVDAHGNAHDVLLFPAKDIDLIGPWTSAEGDADGFVACISQFDAKLYA